MLAAVVVSAPVAAGRASLHGTATWYAASSGRFAAGPELRAWIGPAWRGKAVTVCAGDRCVSGRLLDWCACRSGHRVVDLPAVDFSRLGPLSRGVLRVTVTRP
jgi:hypothetical protein